MVIANYCNFNSKQTFKITEYGRFFPKVAAEPLKYIIPQPEFREILTILKSKGKHLFMATNSHYDYSQLIMETTIGKDWLSFFEVNCCYCRKPKFF
mmetsp:Transcript_15011/g.10892  ORF Transcript_15011/g.10892 Transcript_15011/m.10892 type:complete len:96 (+) Transcript_15011:559-846(+)